MTTSTYNGWKNYETWVVSLWMDNDEASESYWRERAQELFEDAEATRYSPKKEVARQELAEELKTQHEEALPEVEGFAADLLNAAMSEVDWYEIAAHLLCDVEEEEEEADDEE